MNIEKKKFNALDYIVRYPEGFSKGKKYPVIFFMHGAGGRGTDMSILEANPLFTIIERNKEFPFIIVAPQCSANTWFDLFECIKQLALHIFKEEYTDRERMYAMGASMGGYGVWQLAMSIPELFAAIIPICGGGMYWNAARLINVPVWAFHGAKDDCVFPEESKKMTDAVNNCGGRARLTIYPDNGHNAWSDTYADASVFEWLLSNKNINTKDINDIYNDSKIYG